jgi:hypothetical protein
MIVVETAPFTDDMLLRFVVSGPAQALNQQERDRARDERSDGLPEHHAVRPGLWRKAVMSFAITEITPGEV